jgi:transposase
MSTSLLYHGFGVREIVYQRTEYGPNKIVIGVVHAQDRLKCATCGSSDVSLRGKKDRRFRSVPIGRKAVEIVYPIHRLQCHDCGSVRQTKVPFADPYQRHTRSFERYVLDLCQRMTMKDVADHLQVHWDVVKTIQKRYLKRHFSKPKLNHLQRIAVDEIAVAKGHRYVTVVLDLDSGAVVFVGEGKGADALNPFWMRLKRARKKIQAVAMDMSPAYIDAVRTHLPQAFIVFDRFHVMKLFNDRLSHFRREIYSQMKDKSCRSVLKGIRWLLLKNSENLDDSKNERERLEEALKMNQPLAKVYYLKDLLRSFWDCWDYQDAALFLDQWIEEAKAADIRMLYGMAKTLERHRQGLLNYFLYPITTAPLE